MCPVPETTIVSKNCRVALGRGRRAVNKPAVLIPNPSIPRPAAVRSGHQFIFGVAGASWTGRPSAIATFVSVCGLDRDGYVGLQFSRRISCFSCLLLRWAAAILGVLRRKESENHVQAVCSLREGAG